MDSFKMPEDARLAFKRKVNNKLLPSTLEIKREIKTETQTEFHGAIQSAMGGIKQEDIKMEFTTGPLKPMSWYTAMRFDPDTKHDITTFVSETENKRPASTNTMEHKYSIPDFSTKTFQQRKKSAYKKYPRQRRKPTVLTAINLHKYLSSKDPNSLTEKQLDSLTWAESVIMASTLRRMNKDSNPAPIEVSDNASELNEAFIHDETVQLIPDTFQLAIVDFASPGGRYSLGHARLIEKTLSKSVVTYILENPGAKPPLFGKSVYFDGVLVLDCKDQHAYNFAKLILSDIKLWDGSKLKMLEPEKTPFDSIGSINAPDVGVDKNKVLDILKAQNPSINMDNWKMLGETRYKEGYNQYSIKICNPPVYFQRHKQLRLYFGGSEVILKQFGCQWLWNCKV